MTSRRLVIDANILVRAVLGPRVRNLIVDFAEEITFFAPSVAFADASRHLPTLVGKRGIDTSVALSTLDTLRALVDDVPDDLMAQRKDEALRRLQKRDADDWPILAAALALDCPIWTEDKDFFGAGVPTWVTALVEIYLRDEDQPMATGK